MSKMKHQPVTATPDQPVSEEAVRVPITTSQLLALFLRDAAAYGGLTDETVCSFGWWKTMPGDEFPSFNARLRVTLGELRRAAESERTHPEESERAP